MDGIKAIVCQDCILQLNVLFILMVFVLPLPTDCKLYSGCDNDEQLAATTEQAACIHQLKRMLCGESTISTQACRRLLGWVSCKNQSCVRMT